MKSTTKRNNAQLNTDFSSEEIIAIGQKAYEEATAITRRQAEVGRTLTQNDKIALVDDKTLVIGADVGSEKHDIRAFDNRGREFSKKAFEFENNEAGFTKAKAWILSIRDDRHMEKVMVGMEPTGHYWINLASWLMVEGITVVLVNPHHVKKSKELDDNLNRKTDRKDPKVIAGLVHEGRYSMPYLPDGVYANLRNLNNLRLMNTEEKTRCMNRLNRWLSIYFPEFGTVFKDVSGAGSILLLEQAALPEDIISLGADGVNKIWREAKLRGVGYTKALKIVSAAEHSIGCTEGLDIARSEIQWILENLKTLVKWEDDLLEKIETIANEIPYVDNMLAIKGLGMRTVVGIFAEIGDITRFSSVKPIQKLAGLALVEDSSGKHEGKTIISKRGRKRLRYHLYQAGLVLIVQNAEFKEVYDYYRTRDENPLKKMQALMAVACKLLRVLYAMVTKGVTYDPQKLLSDIRRPQKKAA
mgnify:CR=1 FL=1